jgi:hypothetical protein
MACKVVYNTSYGGFALTKVAAIWLAGRGLEEAILWLGSEHGSSWGDDGMFFCYSLARHSPLLVECVEALGEAAGGERCCLVVGVVEDLYRIEDYDGMEALVTPETTLWISAKKDPVLLDT